MFERFYTNEYIIIIILKLQLLLIKNKISAFFLKTPVRHTLLKYVIIIIKVVYRSEIVLKASVEALKLLCECAAFVWNLSESLSSFLILWALIEIHRDLRRPRGPVQFRVRASHLGTPAWSQAPPVWRPLCHVSGLVRGSGGPCYWKALPSRSPRSILPSCDLISSGGKSPISVIFYFVMKVSEGCEKEETCRKSPPWENRLDAHSTARRVDVLFSPSASSASCCLTWTRTTDKEDSPWLLFLPFRQTLCSYS